MDHTVRPIRWYRVRIGITLGVLVLLCGANLSAQCGTPCTDAGKPCVCVLEPADAAVTVTPFGAVQRQPARVGQSLNAGDQIASVRPEAIASLACPGGSEVTLHGRFHAVVRPSAEGQDCVFDLLAGNADVLAAKPTQIEAGETVMGSTTTQWGMRVQQSGGALSVECVVFEGEAQVRHGRWSQPLRDSATAVWRRGSGDPALARVGEREIRTTASVYARADLARLRLRGQRPEDPKTLLGQLNASYVLVMTRPRDAQARIQLAALQTNLGNASKVLYHLARVESEPAQREQKTAIAVMRYAALKQTGRDAEAGAEIEKLRTLDPAQYEQIRTLDPSAIRVRRLPSP